MLWILTFAISINATEWISSSSLLPKQDQSMAVGYYQDITAPLLEDKAMSTV